jgi:hypothetical protein
LAQTGNDAISIDVHAIRRVHELRVEKEYEMSAETDDELLDAARRLVGDATAVFFPLTHTESGYARADATLDDFGGAIHKVATGLNEWLRAYEGGGGEETRQRGLDRQQPET